MKQTLLSPHHRKSDKEMWDQIRECGIYGEALGCKGASLGGLISKLRQFALVIGNEGAICLRFSGLVCNTTSFA